MLSSFEGTTSSEDPFAVILSEAGYTECSKWVKAHWTANEKHDHGNLAERLCELAGPISKQSAMFCGRLVELSAWLQDRIADEL